jgi:predicted ATP-grasp superfamily ATP-dependent carboligase
VHRKQLPHAFVLGLVDTGYGVVRSLAAFGVPLVAFERARREPEVVTRLCRVRHYDRPEDLLEIVPAAARLLPVPPALFVTTDPLVHFVAEHRSFLRDYVRLDVPDLARTRLLLEKETFTEFALEHGFSLPPTEIIRSRDDLERCRRALRFPCVLKPSWRDARWKAARFPKVFRFDDRASFDRTIDAILAVQPNLIVQEWVPGSDADIYFSLIHFDARARPTAQFTGRKLRQWPVGTGSTACAEPAAAPEVAAETLRLFSLVGYTGFGSVEFKRDARTGEYRIMEPTVGRPNHQSYLATANGVNMPLAAYGALTGVPVPPSRTAPRPVLWIDDQCDLLSIAVNAARRTLDARSLAAGLVRPRAYRLWNEVDPGPFFFLTFLAPLRWAKRLLRAIVRGRASRPAGERPDAGTGTLEPISAGAERRP